MTDQQEYRWTAKLPALLVGVAAIVIGVLGWRKSAIFGGAMILLGGAAIIYSTSIRSWCAPNEVRYGKLVWGKGQFHEPSLMDCIKLTRIVR